MSNWQKDVQVVKKMSNVKKSNMWTMEEVHKKVNYYNEVCNFDVKYEGHENCSKTLSMHIWRFFGHHHM